MTITESGVERRGADRPAKMAPEEWALRCQLADCYNLFHHLGWSEGIFNHITVRLPGPDRHYLLNPYGFAYEEVTPENLVKVDVEGKPLTPSPYGLNPASFIIHGAIHVAREDAHCVIHVHTTEAVAVACKEAGLSYDNFYGVQLYGRVAYHDFEGITVFADEQPRMVKNLGDKDILILRNHGLLVVGPDIPRAFYLLWTLQRACEVQTLTASLAGPDIKLEGSIITRSAEACAMYEDQNTAQLIFDAMVRRMRRETPGQNRWTNQ